MVEFALVAPLAFLLIMGIVVVSIIVLHQNQLSNASRDIARVAAICGQTGSTDATTLPPIPPATTGLACSDANLLTYARAQLANIDSQNTWNPTVTVVNGAGVLVAGNTIANCKGGYAVHVDLTYPQQLYLPLISNLFGPGGVRALSATGVASCEQ
jgi:Flp pilus assembly protein TadG